VVGLITSLIPSSKSSNTHPDIVIHQSLLSMFAFVENNHKFFKMIRSNHTPEKFFKTMYSELFNYFRNSFSYVSNDDKIQSIDSNIFSSFTTSALLGVIIYWISNNMKYSANYMAKIMATVINDTPTSLVSMNNTIQGSFVTLKSK